MADDVSLTEAERTRGREFATKLSMRVLARAWQMLLKGIAEVEASGRPLAAAEMVLVRIAYAADLPTPDEVIRSLGDAARGNGSGNASTTPTRADAPPPRAQAPARAEPRGAPRAALVSVPAALNEPRVAEETQPTRAVASFEELVALAVEKRDIGMKSVLERDVRLVRFEDGKLEIAFEASAPKTMAGDLSKKLADWTGRRWMVVVSAEPGAPSLRAQAEARNAELKDGVRADPLVQAVLNRFPGAEIVSVRPAPGAAATNAEDMPLTTQSDGDFADDEEP
jgi:DNA polymerase III subunit gamma/tau